MLRKMCTERRSDLGHQDGVARIDLFSNLHPDPAACLTPAVTLFLAGSLKAAPLALIRLIDRAYLLQCPMREQVGV